jgi:5'-nucleotidase/UDP-sugar diphosphatase
VILVDTGDALIGGGVLGDQTKGEAVVEAMNMMGYDALALGPKELSLGPDLLRERAAAATFPFLSANVVLAGTQKLFAESYTLMEVDGHAIGIIGLTAPSPQDVPGFAILDPKPALVQTVSEVRGKAATIVVLTNMVYDEVLALAGAVPGIDLVVAARPNQLPTQVAHASGTGTLVVTAEQPLLKHSGRRVGRLEVMLAADGRLQDRSWQSLPMTTQYVDDPAMTALLNRLRSQP